VWTRLEQCLDLRVQETRVRALDSDADAIPGCGEGHEYDSTVIRAAHTVTPGREFVDPELERLGRAAHIATARATPRTASAARLRYRAAPQARETRSALMQPSIVKPVPAMPEG
jgi:hypothetical protein